MKHSTRTIVSLCLTAALTAACAKDKPAKAGDSAALAASLPPGHVPVNSAGEIALTPEGQALIDSGNAAFRAGQHKEALAIYQRAAKLAPMHPAPWFGTYMAAKELKDTALADSALRMLKERAPGIEGHPIPGDGSMKGTNPHGGAMPAPGSPQGAYSPHGSPSRPKASS